MRRLASWCVRHRWAVIGLWIVAVLALGAAKYAAGSAYRDSFKLSGTDSFDALNLLEAAAPQVAGDTEQIVVATAPGQVDSPRAKRQVAKTLAQLKRFPGISSVESPYGRSGRISPDRSVALGTVNFSTAVDQITPARAKRFVALVGSGRAPGIQIEAGGQVAEYGSQPQSAGTLVGGIAALIVLLFVFGSLLAATTPLLTTALALGVGTAIEALLSHLIGIASFSSELSLLIGLGVGVDYALFIVTRMRQGLERGKSVDEAIVDALDTSGRAVFFAGITVCIALLGMFALGVVFLYGVAVAASIVVACTVLAALTLLPALLALIGVRVLSRRQRRLLHEGRLHLDPSSTAWGRWARTLARRPSLFAALATALLVALALPALSMRLGSSDAGSDPAGSTTRKAYDLLARGFGPGSNGPFLLVAKLSGPAQLPGFERARQAVAQTPGIIDVTPTQPIPARGGGLVALAQAVPVSSPQDKRTSELLNHLRERTVPGAKPGVRVLVGGQTAIFTDFSAVLARKLPLFIGVVVALSMLLLLCVFRSLLIPVIGALMNMLSAVAAFGVVTAVFQDGFGASLLGLSKTGPIEAFVPVLMFAILFGLSMDYQVFLVTRIYEEWHRTGSNREAVSTGLAATGRTITAAAAIMLVVFCAFILGGQRIIELFGLGLASAVALDALIVRSILVPALMLRAGKANWWLPRALDKRLPHLNVEGSVEHD